MKRMVLIIFGFGFFIGADALAQNSLSLSPGQQLLVGRLPCEQPQESASLGIRQLAWELVKRTSIEAKMETIAVDPTSAALYDTPFLLWSCRGPAGQLSPKAITNLRKFLVMGGFLFIDDPEAAPEGTFATSIRKVLSKLFPDKKLAEISYEHVIYKTFFIVDRPSGRTLAGRMSGIELADRMAVVFSPNDLLGAMSKDLYGNWVSFCEPGGEFQREMSFRLGINIVYYSMCVDYKDDRVHLPFILKRRKL
jgi:hypothetical protein